MKMNLINIPLILKGYPIHKAFKTLIKIKNLSISEFEEYINISKKLLKFFDFELHLTLLLKCYQTPSKRFQF